MRIKAKLKRLIEDERDATALEYGLIATGIFLVIVLAVNCMPIRWKRCTT
ncbi:MAG: hypothetical protein V3V55_04855 [Rhodospirillales bacterium]